MTIKGKATAREYLFKAVGRLVEVIEKSRDLGPISDGWPHRIIG